MKEEGKRERQEGKGRGEKRRRIVLKKGKRWDPKKKRKAQQSSFWVGDGGVLILAWVFLFAYYERVGGTFLD